VKFAEHKDSVFCINYVPKEPYNMFISGDCNDKAYVWKILKEELNVESQEEADQITSKAEEEKKQGDEKEVEKKE
jgi:hypothetical protein